MDVEACLPSPARGRARLATRLALSLHETEPIGREREHGEDADEVGRGADEDLPSHRVGARGGRWWVGGQRRQLEPSC